MKDPEKGNAADNFRSISCLPLMWKLMIGIIAKSMYTFMDTENIRPEEQKACRRSRGTKDQLLIYKAILRDCKRRHKDLTMAWVDYRKAYDPVSHSSILECMSIFGIAEDNFRPISCLPLMWKLIAENS